MDRMGGLEAETGFHINEISTLTDWKVRSSWKQSTSNQTRYITMPFPPPAQKGMTQLNREAFKRVLKVYAVRIPAPKVMAFQKQIRRSVVETYHALLTPKNWNILSVSDLFNQPKLRNVVDDKESKETRLILLRSDVSSPGKIFFGPYYCWSVDAQTHGIIQRFERAVRGIQKGYRIRRIGNRRTFCRFGLRVLDFW